MTSKQIPKSLSKEFYERPVLDVAQDLIGCVIEFNGCAGVIVETEAYHDSEPACHAHVGVTPRTKTLFGPAGRAYVYRSYGIHSLINAVAEAEGVGAAVLIRAIEPISGVEDMRSRRKQHALTDLGSGPGKLTEALGIGLELNESDLTAGPIKIRPHATEWQQVKSISAQRIGISKAVDLMWRFCAKGSHCVSKPWPAGLHS